MQRFHDNASGSTAVVNYNGTFCCDVRNGNNDVFRPIGGDNNTVVEYAYDSWGRQISCTGSLANTLGNLNPFRYRGYVYDAETGFYYVSSRYYDPEIGRFISPDTTDVLTATPMGLTDKNLYPRGVRSGIRQLQKYNKDLGGGFNLRLELY